MEVHLQFDGMTCAGCAKSIEKALASVPGVETARVSYAAKTGVVLGEGIAPEQLVEAVAQAGYRAELIGAADQVGGDEARTRPLAQKPSTPAHARAKAESGSYDYDLLIIGTGGAGMSAAIRASEIGARVAIIEGAPVLGGTCVNVGCIPSKNLIEAAARYHAARKGFPGISACEPQLAWSEVVAAKRTLVESLREQKYEDVLVSYEGVTVLRGRASFLDAHRIRVGEQEVSAAKVIIATGTSSTMATIPGLEGSGALDSTAAMELERLPESLLVIGAGYVGLELGQVFARFGVRVIIVSRPERIMATEDPAVSAELERALRDEGIEIHTGVTVTAVEKVDGGFAVRVRDGSMEGIMKAEQVLVATGRIPNTEGLGLDRAGVEVDARGFVAVDELMRTSNEHVFAAGDVTGGPGYVYVAALQGGIAAQAALADRTDEGPIPIDLTVMPRVMFTDPQVASVGMTEAQAISAGLRAKVTTLEIKHLPRAAVTHTTHGIVKLVAEEGTDRLLGAHMVTTNAGDVIGEATLVVRFGLTTRDLVSTLHAYLTWGESLKLAGQTFTKDVAKLSCCA